MIRRIVYKEKEFCFNGRRGNGLKRFVLEVVAQYVSKHPEITFNELKNVFPDALQNNREHKKESKPRLGVFAKITAVRDEKRYFIESEVVLKDCTIVVCTEWGQLTKTGHENLLSFVKYAQDRLKLDLEITYDDD